jgi:hypothetical protein
VNEYSFAFLPCLVAVALMTEALKDVVKKSVLPYVSPREYVVNVYG